MASQTRTCGTGADDSSVGDVAWGSPSNVTADDGLYASCSGGTGQTSHLLKCTNLGFSIPSGATIDGISVTFQRKIQSFGGCNDNLVKLVKGGSVVGNNNSAGAAWSSSDVNASYGGSSDLWGVSWTDTDINASNFGAVLQITIPSGVMGAAVDYCSITVTYTEESIGGPGTGSYWVDGFMTFRNVAIPKAATINKAFIRFTAKAGGGLYGVTNDEDDVELMIFGNDVDDSSPPTDHTTYLAKTLTDSCQSWSELAHWTDETTYDTPNIACIIQEIVDRSGWVSGNDISIYVQNNFGTEYGLLDIGRRSYDYGMTPAKSPQLFVYYVQDVTTSGGVVCGGSATYGKINSPTIAAQGVLAAGTGTYAKVCNPTIAAQGVVCSGTATVSGGHSVYSETGSGGVVVSGTAYDPTYVVVPRGVVCGGSASITVANVYIPTGGVVVGGTRWKYRKTLTVPTARVSQNLDKFYLPVAVQLDPLKASSDVEFRDSTNTRRLAFELRAYDAGSGRLWAYIKTPLASGSNNVIYLYYGRNF